MYKYSSLYAKNHPNILLLSIVFSALASPGVAYGNVYLYHVLIVVFILSLISKKQRILIAEKAVIFSVPILAISFCVFIGISLAVVRGTMLANVRDIVQILLSFLALLVAMLLSSRIGVNGCRKTMIIFSLLILFIGFMESATSIRMPFSPYSDYAVLFNKDNIYQDGLSQRLIAYIKTKPTVFWANPNTYGYVLLLCIPLMLLSFTRVTAILLSLLIVHVFLIIDSRILFILAVMAVLIAISIRRVVVDLFIVILMVPVLIGLQATTGGPGGHRVIAAVDQSAAQVVEMVKSFVGSNQIGENSPSGSADGAARQETNSDTVVRSQTATDVRELVARDNSVVQRSAIYRAAWDIVVASKGVGLGFGGLNAALADKFGAPTASHNFLLQLAADTGVIGVAAFLFAVGSLVVSAVRRWLSFGDLWSLGIAFSLLLAMVASLVPSGLNYVLAFWTILGLYAGYRDLPRAVLEPEQAK